MEAWRAARDLLPHYLDASASRAYYAAFYAVSPLLALRGQSFSKHSAVEAAVHRDLVRTGQWPPALGRAYSYLLELRTTGDYGGGEHVTREEAEKALANVRLILLAVRQAEAEVFSGFEQDS